ncbi:immunoglobulin-like domain-containing protein, partial [Hyunsoonleella sp. 2307UL5-6]|uniref:immunoglobulin-like domain-containing protein n=1 Tax=Hyunsoonleella sp. 2307UL5-6 TaxID=3384768 RepID=UPI0039BD8422
TYDVTDAAGNSATQEVRTINIIPDTTAPVITLNGAATIDLSLGDVYTEAGATATDDLDGDITAAIVIGGDIVDINTAGTYLVTYDVTDAAGNSATQEVRTINIIPDTTAPVITLNGAATIDLSLGDVYTEAGATATDDLDGDITAAIIIGGDIVDTNTAGTYVVTYNVSDASGNAATELIRTVTVSSVINGCSGGIASFPYAEGFENTLGGWVQSSSDDLDWLIDANGTPSNNTGPSSAIEGNSYIFVEASVNGTGFPNKRALLTSPCFDLSALTQATFSFNYHMFGATDIGTIALEISDDEGTTWTSIWSESGNKGNSWQTATINLSTYVGRGIQLRFNRFVGSTWQADIAIDAISLIDEEVIIESCSGGITNFPYIESYENTIGDWTQSTTDDINWTVDANGTPSNGTGPSSAIDGGSYIYVEASGNGDGFPNKQAIINSPCYDLTSVTTASFSFNYHMFGAADIGTIALEASNDNGMSWTTLWSESGNKGNSWQSQIIDLSVYVGNSVQLRFNRVTGGTWQADIAIDNINLTTSSGAAKDTIKDKFDTISNTLTLYPNPVKDVLNLKTLKRGILTYKIINSLGQIIHEGKEGNRIIVDRLEAGMYFIEVTQGNDKMMKRFIKE